MILHSTSYSFYLVTNAGRADRDMAWIKLNVLQWNESHATSEQVKFGILSNWGLIALQGASDFNTLLCFS